VDIALISNFVAQASPAPAPSDSGWKPVEVLGGFIFLIPAALVSLQTLRHSNKSDPLDRRKIELEILEKERALGIAHEQNDQERIAAITAESVFERRTAQELVLRFVLLYLVLQLWGILGNLFNIGYGGYAFLITIVPQVIRALIFVAIGWPLLLDTATFLNVQLPDFIYRNWVRWLLIIIAILAAGGSRNLLSGLLLL